jgi:hypothetical protein
MKMATLMVPCRQPRHEDGGGAQQQSSLFSRCIEDSNNCQGGRRMERLSSEEEAEMERSNT